MAGLLSSSSKILCIHIEERIPLISDKVQPKDALCSLITLNNFSSSLVERKEKIITSKVEEGLRYAYRR